MSQLSVLPAGWLLLPLVAAAIPFDLKDRRIPNALCLLIGALGLALAAGLGGLAGFREGAAGFATGLLLFLPFHALGGMGAGDVKLMAAAGTWLGIGGTLAAGLLTLVAGGVIALLFLRRGAQRLPYAPAIATGVALSSVLPLVNVIT